METIVLASGSPRRKELLSRYFDITVKTCPTDETIPEGMNVTDAVMHLATQKAKAVADTLKGGNHIVIGADTVVVADNKILGKPEDDNEAFTMLSRLSGRSHTVYTGFCVINTADGYTVSDYEATEVIFRELSKEEITGYIKTKEPSDKAGAYGIQGLGGAFVSKIIGDYNNVVGLPVCKLLSCLKNNFNKGIFSDGDNWQGYRN